MIREKVIPVAWLMLAALIIGSSIGFAARADAAQRSAPPAIIVSIGWDGTDCIQMWEPDADTARTTTLQTFTCAAGQAVSITYQPKTGQWVGVDPIEAPGVALACEIRTADTDIVIVQSAGFSGVNCLGRW